ASGSKSGTFLAAAIPAMRATANTSPLGTVPSRKAWIMSGEHATSPCAVAARTVGVFSVTSTMYASPALSRCVNFIEVILLSSKSRADIQRLSGHRRQQDHFHHIAF